VSSIVGWQAIRVDGVARESHAPGAGLADPEVREAVVRVDSGAVRVKARPERGERIRVFTRRSIGCGVSAAGAEPAGTVVLEIAPDPDKPERVVRLYIGREVVLSTEDLYG
jgi:hypothetical protein